MVETYITFLDIENMTDVLISSYQTGGAGGAMPVEEVSLNCIDVDWG